MTGAGTGTTKQTARLAVKTPEPSARAGAIEFWFDFSSPYAFFADRAVDKVATKHGRVVVRQPFLLGPAFKATGMQSLSRTPIRGDYARRDWARLARKEKLPFALPPFHPIVSMLGARMFYGLQIQDAAEADRFSRRAFDAHYMERGGSAAARCGALGAGRWAAPRNARSARRPLARHPSARYDVAKPG